MRWPGTALTPWAARPWPPSTGPQLMQALHLYRAKVTGDLGILHAVKKRGLRSAGAQARKKKDKQDLRDL